MHAAPRRILIVDDEGDTALSLAALLRLDGYETHVARDGLEALQKAEQLHPDIVLLDVGLPKLGGFEVCRRLRLLSWASETLIVALTGWAGREYSDGAREAGFDAYLLKPVGYKELLKILATSRSRESSARA